MPAISDSASPSSGTGPRRTPRMRGHLPVDLNHRRTRSLDQSPNASADSPSGLSSRDVSHLPRAVRELQDFNAPPRSSSSESRSPSRNRGTARSKPRPKHRLSKIERELLPYNSEPVKDSRPRATSSASQIDIEDSRRDIEHRKNLNVKRLMQEQILPKSRIQKDPNATAAPGVPVTRLLDMTSDSEHFASGYGGGAWTHEEDETSMIDDKFSSISGSISGDFKMETSHNPQSKALGAPEVHRRRRLVRVETEKAELLYEEWLEKSTRIKEILAAPFYLSSPPTSDKIRSSLENIPEGIEITMEEGLYVFHPSLEKYQDFPTFLSEIEEIAGREMGVVKVVIPKESHLSPPSGAASANQSTWLSENVDTLVNGILASAEGKIPNLDPFQLEMAIHPNTRVREQSIYKVSSHRVAEVPACMWREDIEKHRETLKKNYFLNEDGASDAWNKADFTGPSEIEMIESFGDPQEDALYAMDNDATPELRAALGCIDPKLTEIAGNSLMKSRTRVAGIHSPYFYVSNRSGTPFGMHVEDFAAYSLNYLHVGAPKKWYVVRPRDHRWLEEVMHEFLHPEERLLSSNHMRKPRRPPQCGQFLRHESLYIPEEALRSIGVCYTRVLQHQGEMVITFPFAYHQGYNTGPNIAEAIGYASDRWEIFIREGVYQNCRRSNCKIEPINLDFSFIKNRTGHGRQSKIGKDSPESDKTRSPRESRKSMIVADSGRNNWRAQQRDLRRLHQIKNESQSLFVSQDSSSDEDEVDEIMEVGHDADARFSIKNEGLEHVVGATATPKRKKESPPGTPPQHIRHRRAALTVGDDGDIDDETEEEADVSSETAEQHREESINQVDLLATNNGPVANSYQKLNSNQHAYSGNHPATSSSVSHHHSDENSRPNGNHLGRLQKQIPNSSSPSHQFDTSVLSNASGTMSPNGSHVLYKN